MTLKLTLRSLLLLAAGLLITGCVTMTAESDINEDLSGTHALTVTMDTEFLNSMGEEFSAEEAQEEITPEDVPEGYTVEPIEGENLVGAKISTTVEDSEPLGDVLNDLFNAGTTDGELIEPFSGTLEKDGNEYRLNVTVDGNALSQSTAEEMQGSEDMGITMEELLEMTYSIKLPGELQETNGEELPDGRIQWTLPVDGTLEMTAVSETEGGGALTLILVVLGIGALLLIGIVAVVVLLLFSMRKAEPTPAAPAGPAPEWMTNPPAATSPDPSTQPTTPSAVWMPPAPPPAGGDSTPSGESNPGGDSER